MSLRLPAFALLVLLVAGCASPKGNLIVNGGFEEGTWEWFWIEDSPGWVGGMEVTDASPLNGSQAARTRLETDGMKVVTIVGGVQEVTRDEMGGRLPERLTVSYRVDEWKPSPNRGALAYSQVVVGVFPRDTARDEVCPLVELPSPCQISFPLVGITQQPFEISNRRFVFTTDGEPRIGEWRTLEVDLREAFLTEWGVEPRLFGKMWVYLEVRHEHPPRAPSPQPTEVVLDVAWDDVRLE